MKNRFCILPLVATAAAVVCLVFDGQPGGRKLVNRKIHGAEQTARVIFIGADALLVGHAVVIGGDQVLCGAFQTDDGENAKRYK